MKKFSWILIPVLLITACSKSPQTLKEFEKAGREAYLDEEYDLARQYLRQAVILKSSDRDVLYYLGLSFQREYLLDSALFYLKRADLLYPNDREVNSAIYPIASELREWETAIRAINCLIRTGDPLEKYRLVLADLNAKQGNETAALVHAQMLLEAEPDNPDRFYQVAVLAHRVDSMDLAMKTIDAAVAKFGPQDRFFAVKARVLTTLGQFEQAENTLRPLYERDTASVEYRYLLAFSLSLQGPLEKKREAYRLYRQIQNLVVDDYMIDSAVAALAEELNIEQ